MAGKTDTVNPVSNAELATQSQNKKAEAEAEKARKKAEADAKKAQEKADREAKAETKRKNKEAEEHTKAQQKIANDLSTAYLTGKIDKAVVDQLNENAKNGIDLPAELPYKGSEAEKAFRKQYMPEQPTKAETNTVATNKGSNTTPKEKTANDYTYADLEEKFGGNKEEIEEWIGDNPEFKYGDKTSAALGEEAIARIEAKRAKKAEEAQKAREAERKTQETANIEEAKDELVSGTEGEINAKVDALQEQIDEKGNERAKKYADRVKEFTEGVDDYYIEGLPKGVWQQYKSGEYGYSKKQAQDKLDKLHEGEITWSKKRRDYLLKHPELANEKERKIIDSYKKAKSTLGYFALDAIATGLGNIAKGIKGDTDLNLSMSQKMNQTNLEKAIERRNEKYGTSHQNQWRAMVDSMDLSKEARQKLQDIQVTRPFQKAFAKLDRETQKAALDAMAKWEFSPSQIADLVAAREILKEDPDAKDIVLSQLASKGIDLAEKKGVLGFLGL